MNPSENLVAVGEIAGAFGIRGEVKMIPLMRDLSWLSRLSAAILCIPGSPPHAVEIETSRRHHGLFLVRFAGFDRNRAEAVRGATLNVLRGELPPLGDGEWYEFDLIGLSVRTQTGKDLGTLERVLYSDRSNDTWETSVALIPAVSAFVVEVDIAAGQVVVVDDPGLLK